MSHEGEDEGYNDAHRAFLQAFMARSTMTLDEAKPVLAAIFTVHEDREILPEDITQADLSNVIAAINTSISPFDLEIRSTINQNNQTRVYALVNTTSDPLMQLATTYSADEIAFVKRVLDAMFETNNTTRQELMTVSSMQAVRLARVSGDRRESYSANGTQGGSAQSLSLKEAEEMLKRLVDEGWFEKSRKGYYSLSPRALMELRSWLVLTYNDEDEGVGAGKIKNCMACKEIITVGQRCPRRECPARLHDMCTRNFFRVQRSQTCPLCRTEWTGENFVGERADTARRDHRRSGIGADDSGTPRRSGIQVDGANGDGSEG